MESKDSIFTVTAKAVVAMNLFRADDAGMGQISGINIRPDGRGGALLTAMNEHQAALLHEPFSPCENETTITPSKAFIKALKEYAKEPVALVRYDGERLYLVLGENTILDQHYGCACKSGDKYPNVEFVRMAEDRRKGGYKSESLSIPYDGLKIFQAVAKLYGADKVRVLSLFPSGPKHPCLVRMDCNEDFLGVIMPMMIRDGDEAVERTEALRGFEGINDADLRSDKWTPGEWHEAMFKGGVLFASKVYMNGNLHFKFHKEFMGRLNVEAGRLLGWVTSQRQAEEEMGDNAAKGAWGTSFALDMASVKALAA